MKVLVLSMNTDRVEEDAAKLRGYIGNRFPEHVVLHHHVAGDEYLRTYPRVQYKIIEGTPLIVGIEEGAGVLKDISDELDELRLGTNTYPVKSTQMTQWEADFGKCRENIQYQFVTPWLALNPDNYRKYKALRDWKEKKELLNSIIVGNILSMCKGFNYVVMGTLYAHSHLYEDKVEYKGIPHIGFTGEFRVNFRIPDFLGIGMGVSHGFGTVKKTSET